MKAQVSDLGLHRWWRRVTGGVYRVVIARGADLRLCAVEAGRRLPARRSDERGELLGRCRAHAREQVLVGMHRERRMARPSRSLTTLIGTPAATSSDAWVWRRSWNRMRDSSLRRTIRRTAGSRTRG